jgi:hypothetical protein
MADDGVEDPYAVEGDEIRFMWDYGVIVPLWTDEGLLPDDPEWLRRALGLSDTLIARLTRWGEAMEARDGDLHPGSPEWFETGSALTRQGRDLAEALQREVGHRFTVTYIAF